MLIPWQYVNVLHFKRKSVISIKSNILVSKDRKKKTSYIYHNINNSSWKRIVQEDYIYHHTDTHEWKYKSIPRFHNSISYSQLNKSRYNRQCHGTWIHFNAMTNNHFQYLKYFKYFKFTLQYSKLILNKTMTNFSYLNFIFLPCTVAGTANYFQSSIRNLKNCRVLKPLLAQYQDHDKSENTKCYLSLTISLWDREEKWYLLFIF